MPRFLLAALMLSLATPALSETLKQRGVRCDAQAEIVRQAVEMRLKRRSEAKTKAALAETAEPRYAPSVPMLVGFVYTLARPDLKSDVPAAFAEQCKAYQP